MPIIKTTKCTFIKAEVKCVYIRTYIRMHVHQIDVHISKGKAVLAVHIAAKGIIHSLHY